MRLMNGLGILLAIAVLTAPLTASAEIIESYVPTEHDYGDVILGTSENQIFTVTLEDAGDLLYFTSLRIADDPPSGDPTPYTGDAFSITAAPVDGSIIDSGTSFEIEVTFSPNIEGAHVAYLQILSNDTGGNEDIRIPIFGMGVLDEPGPGDEMADLIALFEASVADGSIEGYGPGNSASSRLRAFRNILNAANDLIYWGYDGLACGALFVAYRKSDGVHPPPDFIQGDGRAAINDGIVDVMDALGCFE